MTPSELQLLGYVPYQVDQAGTRGERHWLLIHAHDEAAVFVSPRKANDPKTVLPGVKPGMVVWLAKKVNPMRPAVDKSGAPVLDAKTGQPVVWNESYVAKIAAVTLAPEPVIPA